MYEHKTQQLARPKVYRQRVWRAIRYAAAVIVFSLAIGTLGYLLTIPQMNFFDAFLNASMILSGMGPMIDPAIHLSNGAKMFASLYALFSGVVFITSIGLVISPIAHRFLHKMHLDK